MEYWNCARNFKVKVTLVTVVNFALILGSILASILRLRTTCFDHHGICLCVPLEFEIIFIFHRLAILFRWSVQIVGEKIVGHFLDVVWYFAVAVTVDLVFVRWKDVLGEWIMHHEVATLGKVFMRDFFCKRMFRSMVTGWKNNKNC